MKKIHIEKNQKILLELGFSDKEAKIYLSTLSLGAATISEIAEAAGIERTGIYYHIESLLKSGFLKTAVQGKRIKYLASDPERLVEIQEKKKKALEKTMPELRSLFAKKSGKSVIEYFQGREEVKIFYDRVYEILKELKRPDNVIYCLGNSYKTVVKGGKIFLDYERLKEQIDIVSKVILSESQREGDPKKNTTDPYIVTRYNLPQAQLKYISDKYAYLGSVVIAGDKIIFYDFRNFFYSIIENPNIASVWKMFFQYIWDSLK